MEEEKVIQPQKNTKDMTKGSPWKLIVLFAIPVFLSQTFQQLYNSVDSLIVGNVLGRDALAAVSSSGSLVFLFTSFVTGTTMGAGVIISKYFGEKDYENMQKAIHTNVAFGIVASLVLTVLGVALTPWVLRLMGTAESVLPNSIAYFRWYFFGVTGVVMYNVFNSILQAVGNSRIGLYFLIFSSLLNVVLDLTFIRFMHLGVWAAALATSISNVTSATLCMLFLLKRGTVYQLKFGSIRFHKDMFFKIIKYGVPAGVQNSVIGLANVVVQSNINSFGANAMAGCGSYSKIEGFAFLPITSFTMAITTFVGQNLGAKEYERAKRGSRFGIICSILLAEVVGLIIYTFAPNLIGLFIQTDDDPEAVKKVIQIGVTEARTLSLFYFALAFSHCIASVLRGAGRAIVPMSVMLAIWCVYRVSYITIAMKINHIIKLVFIAYPMTWLMSSVVFLLFYLFSDWVHGYEKKNRKNIDSQTE